MKFTTISLFFSLLTISIAIYFNYLIFVDYHLVDGKTRAFIELKFSHRFYYSAFGFLALTLALIGRKIRHQGEEYGLPYFWQSFQLYSRFLVFGSGFYKLLKEIRFDNTDILPVHLKRKPCRRTLQGFFILIPLLFGQLHRRNG